MTKWFIIFVVFFLGPLTCISSGVEIEPEDEPVVDGNAEPD